MIRLARNNKILCYVLVFDQLEIIKKSLNYITKFGDKLDIVVIENPSPNSNEIDQYITELGEKGLIKRFYLFQRNITGNAYDVVLSKELKKISKRKAVIITDGDLISSSNALIEEELSILKHHPEVFAVGSSLDMSNLPLSAFPDAGNWIPQDIAVHKDFYEACTGGHFLMFRGKDFSRFMKWKNKNNINFVDGEMHKYCYEVIHKKWARTKKNKAYHLTWDLYTDKNNNYTKLKTGKSFNETWYHKRKSSYKLLEFN